MDDRDDKIITIPDVAEIMPVEFANLSPETQEKLLEAGRKMANAFSELVEKLVEAMESIDWGAIAEAITKAAQDADIDIQGIDTDEPDNEEEQPTDFI